MAKFVLISLLAVSLIMNAVLIFRYAWVRPSNARSWLVRGTVSTLSLVICALILEIGSYQFLVMSDGFGFTLSSKRWFEEYWHPVNSYGYRDVEHGEPSPTASRVLFVVGDSFVAGHGIEDYRLRFSNILGSMLGERWDVINIAKNGWDTRDELIAIEDYPLHPDSIVLSYFINDISGAATKGGLTQAHPVSEPTGWLGKFVGSSHFLNFAYWRAYRFNNSEGMGEGYRNYLARSFEDEDIWAVHEQELLEIVRYVRHRDIVLTVVVFPSLVDIEGTRMFSSRVVELFRSNDVRVVDVSDVAVGRDTSELVVNLLDGHPSLKLHDEVASLLYHAIVNGP